MRIPKEAHSHRDWRVFPLIHDFHLEDVWQFPLADRGDPIAAFSRFCAIFKQAMTRLATTGLAGWLFRLRIALGRVLQLDSQRASAPVFGPNSLLVRYQQAYPDTDTAHRQPRSVDPADTRFHEVYSLERERLSEIANKTVHAAIHLSWPRLEDGTYTAHMAIYVKATGPFTRAYMALIRPFRLWIVYPALMRRVGKMWRKKNPAQTVSPELRAKTPPLDGP